MKSISLFDLLYIIIGIPTLFMNIVTSRGFTGIKIGLLLLLAIVCVLELLTVKKGIHRGLYIYIIIFIAFMMGSLLFGIANNYEFSFIKDEPLLRYYLITPILLLIFLTIYYKRPDRTRFTISALRHITLFTVVGDIYKILSLRVALPNLDPFGLFTTTNVNYKDVILRISNETRLMYLLPLYIVMLFETKKSETKFEKIEYMIIAICGLLYCILSGRKALELVSFATLVYMIIRNTIKKYSINKLRNLLLAAVGIIIFMMLANSFSTALNITDIFDSAIKTFFAGLQRNEYGVSKRVNDIKHLMDMFFDSPIVGNGLNAYDPYTRSTKNNWSYEVYYNALLAQTGIVGVSIFGFGVFYLILKLQKYYKEERKTLYFATGIAFVSFLICAGTNPIINDIIPWFFTIVIVFEYGNTDKGVLEYEI